MDTFLNSFNATVFLSINSAEFSTKQVIFSQNNCSSNSLSSISAFVFCAYSYSGLCQTPPMPSFTVIVGIAKA